MTPESAYYRGVCCLALLFRHVGHDGSLSSFLADIDVDLYDFTFAHAPLGFVRVVPDDRCLVYEEALHHLTVLRTRFLSLLRLSRPSCHS